MIDDELEERLDERYLEGQRSAAVQFLRTALELLGYDSHEATPHRWIVEREAAIATLRSVCEDFGDNQWPSNLHLSDIIDKHLARHLHATARPSTKA